MDWFLYNNGLRHERVKIKWKFFHKCISQNPYNNFIERKFLGHLFCDTQYFSLKVWLPRSFRKIEEVKLIYLVL